MEIKLHSEDEPLRLLEVAFQAVLDGQATEHAETEQELSDLYSQMFVAPSSPQKNDQPFRRFSLVDPNIPMFVTSSTDVRR